MSLKTAVGNGKQGYLLLTVLSWTWWLINLLAYRIIREEPRYIKGIWTSNFIGLLTVGYLSCMGLQKPSPTLSETTLIILFLTVGIFGGACSLLLVKHICRLHSDQARQTPNAETPEDGEIAMVTNPVTTLEESDN